MIFKVQRNNLCIILSLISCLTLSMEDQSSIEKLIKRSKRTREIAKGKKNRPTTQQLSELFEEAENSSNKKVATAARPTQIINLNISLLFNDNKIYELTATQAKRLRTISQIINDMTEEQLAQQKFSEFSADQFKKFSKFIKLTNQLKTAQQNYSTVKEKIEKKIDRRTLVENLNILKVSDLLMVPLLKDIVISKIALNLQTHAQLETFVNNYQEWHNQFENVINHDLQKKIAEQILQPYLSELSTRLDINDYEVKYPSKSNIVSVLWSPDGTKIAIEYYNGIIHVWDNTCLLINTIIASAKLSGSIAWGSDNNKFAYVSDDKTIRVVDGDNGTILRTLTIPISMEKIAWSPDGNKFAITSSDNNNITIFDVASGKTLYAICGHANRVGPISWSPNGKMIASGADDGTICIWNGDDGKLLKTFNWPIDCIYSLAWNPDNNMLASGSTNKDIIIWNMNEEKPDKILTGHTSIVESIAWNHDGTKIAGGSFSNMGYIWDSISGKLLHRLEDPNEIISVTWNHDGTNLASGSEKNFRIWDTTPLITWANTIKQLNISQAMLILSSLSKKISRNNDMLSILNTLPESIQKHLIFDRIRNDANSNGYEISDGSDEDNEILPDIPLIQNMEEGEDSDADDLDIHDDLSIDIYPENYDGDESGETLSGDDNSDQYERM